ASPRSDVNMVAIPFRDIVSPVTTSIKLRKLLTNMAYVGVLAELLSIDDETLNGSIAHQFQGKEEVMEVNRQAVQAGRSYARENLATLQFPYRAETVKDGNTDKILIDGNSAAAIGLSFGGCSFVSWYPITPSTSLVETFAEVAEEVRVNSQGEKTFAIV